MKKTNSALIGKLPFNRSVVLASLAIATATLGSPQAFAALVCSSAAIIVPASVDGIYVNFVTGATGPMGATTVGWDFNAYASSGALNFFSSNAASNATRYVGSGTTVNVLTVGTVIDATSTFGSAGIAPG